MGLTEKEIEKYRLQLKKLSGTARYLQAFKLAKELHKKYPEVLLFSYYEAVMIAEDDFNFTPQQVKVRFALAAKKLKPLLRKRKGSAANLRHAIKNEFYWFSEQPYKQYLLGCKSVRKDLARSGYYSQGVGAAQLATFYGLKKKKRLALRWAQKSESAWLEFFKLDAKWYNSYFFYARVLAFQNKSRESDKALEKATKLAKKTKKWKAITKEKDLIKNVHCALYPHNPKAFNS